ncbi:hypothetical protein JCM11251_003555 [Rhodosporidiobolus azoricus]
MKRSLSAAGSPPPSTSTPSGSKPKKPRPSRSKAAKAAAPKAGGGSAGSPPPSEAPSPFTPYAGASSPPAFADSPAAGVGGGSRERSMSVAVDPALTASVSASVKGKEKAVEGAADGAGGAGAGGEAEEEEAEDEAFAFDDDEFGSNQREAAKQKEDLRVLLSVFDEQQMDRYEAYRRSGLAKGSVRKLVNQVLGQSVSPSILTVVRGFAKVFVGEIVEKARSMSPHSGPLTPQDLREAYRQYLSEHEGAGAGGQGGGRGKLFCK